MICYALFAGGFYQGNAPARALSHCSVILLKGYGRFVCLNLICSLLCVCSFCQGKASARAHPHRSILLLKGYARFVCLNLICSLLCVCGFYQGKASARALSHRSVILLKGSARFVCLNLICVFALCMWLLSRKGFSKGSFSLLSHPSQGLCKVCMLESDLCLCSVHVASIKGRLQQGLFLIAQSSFSRALQGLYA